MKTKNYIIIETANKIKKLQIQGASKIRSATISALKKAIEDTKAKNSDALRKELYKNMRILLESRPTEPGMRTAMRILILVSHENLSKDELQAKLIITCKNYEKERKEGMEKIVKYGTRKVPTNGTIITYCHSHTVENILINAFKKGRLQKVFCAETRPLYQGRITAKNLTKAGIPTTLVVDGAIASYANRCDAFFSGIDSILEDGSVVNKIGTFPVSLACKRFGVPHYVAGSTHKFDPTHFFSQEEIIEERDAKEIWDFKNKNLTIKNPAFDITPPELIKEIISERGVFGPSVFPVAMYEIYGLSRKSESDLSLKHLLKLK